LLPGQWASVRVWFGGARARAVLDAPRPIASTPGYPPVAEVEALAAAATPVTDDAGVSTWLSSRGLNLPAVARLGLAHALPEESPLPPWARRGRFSWAASGHRLLVPLWGAHGHITSFRARSIVCGGEACAERSIKALAPAGFSVGGLLMANSTAIHLLRDGRRPARVVITEGEPDFLTWATRCQKDDAVLGVVSGSWTNEIANRIPTGTRVIVRTHHDSEGDAYAGKIHRSVAGRCPVLRSTDGEDADRS